MEETDTRKPLRLVQLLNYEPRVWRLQTAAGKSIAEVFDYYEFMEAWMAAPMGKLEVIPNG